MTYDLHFMEGSLGPRKGAWTEEEDELLKRCIEAHGEGKWHQVPLKAGLNRCRKSCRLRWLNYLKPDIKRGKFKVDEIDLMIRLHTLLGNRWSLIAGRLPGRTANDVKNYWNTHLKKKEIAFKQDKKAEIQQVITKANIRKPRTFSFSKNLDSSGSEKTQMFKNNVELGGGQNHDNPSTEIQAAASEDTESMWWERLLNDIEEEPPFVGLAGENFSGEMKVDGNSMCGQSQTFLSDFPFDVDDWNLLNAEKEARL